MKKENIILSIVSKNSTLSASISHIQPLLFNISKVS